MAETVTIAALGAGGDGIVETAEGRVFVPFTLPGEVVEMERRNNRGGLTRVVQASEARATPPCPHFGACGGCALQHMARAPYLAWKRDVVAASFRLHGIGTDVEPVVPTDPGARRRAVFSAVRTAKGTVVGFNRRGTHEVIPITECPVLDPTIATRLPMLREMAAITVKPRKRAHLVVLAADNGLDVAFKGGGALARGATAALAAFASDVAIARLTADGETVFVNRAPEIAADGNVLLPTPGGFVQAVAAAEAALANAVMSHIGPASPVADLFAGIGTFSLRLAHHATVTAVDGDAALIEALNAATRSAHGLKPVTAVRRDLFANPMSAGELDAFAAVVFDPPAAGAKRQAEAIAASRVPIVVAVSCNPATLARDARTLIDGGYRLTRVTPVDQFLWSAEIEVVAAFAR